MLQLGASVASHGGPLRRLKHHAQPLPPTAARGAEGREENQAPPPPPCVKSKSRRVLCPWVHRLSTVGLAVVPQQRTSATLAVLSLLVL
jgi:hypothetical protein